MAGTGLCGGDCSHDNNNANANANNNANANANANDNQNANANTNQNANDNQNANANTNQNANDNQNANANANSNANANANGNESGNAPLAFPAGNVILNWTTANHNPQLAIDGQGRLNLFFQTSTSAGGFTFTQAQLKADGTWTKPTAASPEFQFPDTLTAVPDVSGRLCVLWGAEMFDKNGNAVYGLFRNCQQADGTWLAQVEQPAVTSGPPAFSPARAPDGSLQSVFVTNGKLFYSPISNSTTTALTGMQLSGKLQVLLARLAIDSNGGYHAAWVETTGSADITVQHRYSKDGGHTWSPAEQLYSGSADNPASISLKLAAGSAGQAHLAWDGDNAVHYRRWSASGGWEEPVKLSSDKRSSGVVLAVTKDGSSRAAWKMSASRPSVTMRSQSADGTWSAPNTVTPTRAYELALLVDASGTSQVIWHADDGLRYLAIP